MLLSQVVRPALSLILGAFCLVGVYTFVLARQNSPDILVGIAIMFLFGVLCLAFAARVLISTIATLSNLLTIRFSDPEARMHYQWWVARDGVEDGSTVLDRLGDQSNSFPWREMSMPRLLPGRGIIIIARKHRIIGRGLHLPSTAFANREAAKRFHTALIALWKTNGDPDAVSAEVRAEFAPPL